jgi:hypothetical protein
VTATPKDLTVINLWAGPGAGKSTTAAGLFNLMKAKGLRVELVMEVFKDFVYEKTSALGNQLLLLGLQDQRLRRLVGEVDYAITDSPLPLSLVYATEEYELLLDPLAYEAYERYENVDYFINRTKAYQQYGRSQTEHEALLADLRVRECMTQSLEGRSFKMVDGDSYAEFRILQDLGL